MNALTEYSAAFPGPDRGKAWAAIWLLLALPVAISGWGILARPLLRLPRTASGATPALGLAAFILVGGALNLLRIAFPCVIAGLLLIGIVRAAAEGWACRRAILGLFWSDGKPDPSAWLLVAFAAAVVSAIFLLEVSPTVYNWRDDLQKYFAHPVRMLETGTVYGSPLSAMGSETLGALAVVDASVLVFLPLRDINGADAVLGFLLCLVPVVALGLRHRSMRPAAVLAIASLAVIDAFYVNVSALYLGSALIAGVMVLMGEVRQLRSPGGAAAVGLSYAAMIALKPTFVLFVGLHLGCDATVAAVLARSVPATFRRAASTAGWSGVFLAPWILLHLPRYLAALGHKAASVPGAALDHLQVHLWGTGPLSMGLTGLRAYTILVAIMFLFALFLALRSRASGDLGGALSAAAGGCLAAAAAYPIMLFVFPRVIGYADADPDNVRYFIPFALGTFPAALCLASDAVSRLPFRAISRRSALGLSLLPGLLALWPFATTAAVRFRDAWRYGTLIQIGPAHNPVLAQEMREAIDGPRLAAVRALQSRVPAGASIIAWTNMPYLLDFGRNPIFDAETAGISSAWAAIPDADYVLWEFRGNKDPHARTLRIVDTLPPQNNGRIQCLLAFDRELAGLVEKGSVVFRDHEFLLCRLAPRHP